jgi:hypothetical protein
MKCSTFCIVKNKYYYNKEIYLILGIIGHNFDGGRHTNSNFGSYWPSDFWDLWQKIQRRTPSDNDITCGLLGRWANNWPKYHKEITRHVIWIKYIMKCSTFCIVKNKYYYNKEIAFIDFFMIFWSIVRSPTQEATCNIVITWRSSLYLLSKIPKVTHKKSFLTGINLHKKTWKTCWPTHCHTAST